MCPSVEENDIVTGDQKCLHCVVLIDSSVLEREMKLDILSFLVGLVYLLYRDLLRDMLVCFTYLC